MKKHMVSAVLLLIMMLSLSAQAAEMRVITASPYLTVNDFRKGPFLRNVLRRVAADQ